MAARGFKFLVIADDSAEFAAAIVYAAFRVKATNAALIILRVVDTVTDNAHWVSVGEEMRAEAIESAEAQAERLAAEVWADAGIQPEIVIREGELRAELRRLVDEDRDIRLIVLAAGIGRDGPGPLVSALARGQGLGGRPVPVVVVPGTLSRDEAKALAVPDPGAPDA